MSMIMNDMVLISVDDHISEPPEMYDNHLSGADLASAPKLRATADGTNYWEYQGMQMPSVGLNAVVGRPLEEYGMEPTSFDQLRKGVYDVHARIDDMNANGIAASLNFGTAVGFDGGKFHQAPDRNLARIHMQAYNDWHVDEWCGAYPDRFIPCAILPTWDMKATVAEIKRMAAKGVRAVSLNENPTKQGLPSIHNEYWEPMWKTMVEHDMVMNLHIGAGNPQVHASEETPIEAWIATMPMSSAVGAADWVNLEALHRYPDMKICLSECGLGWIPYFMERADFSHARHQFWTNSKMTFGDLKPSDVFKRNFMVCFIDDDFGLHNLEYVNQDMVAFETDYPHSDTLWPEAPEHLWRSVKHLSDEQINKVTHLNTMRYYGFDMFKTTSREDLTVGALREKAAADGVDLSLKSTGGANPLEGTKRVVTSGDLFKMFSHHATAK
ncbi:MAG: amidohydrolase family protein [Halieaceae bacterium]|nr:amidohydrolase family protein [Halieaceae bacterium]